MISLLNFRKIVIGASLLAAPAASFAGVFISVGFAPPVLPVYAQPICPGDGYLWTPGYWAYAPAGYYWVPGVWVQPPTIGYLWTPPYWGFAGGAYGFHEGYWGQHVGFYGGVNYGFGYGGIGFVGGRWDGGHFAYNSAVAHIGPGFRNTYVDREVVVHNTIINNNHYSFNGGNGINARPSPQEAQAEHENHIGTTANQQQHFQQAQTNRANFASANGGHPAMAAMQRPGMTQGAVAARGANPGLQTNRDGFGHANEVNTRQGNQQSRIQQGVSSGQMTPGETRNVENRDSSITRQANQDRRANGGTLTGQERQQINQRQNNVSQSINQDKHNANTDQAAAARQGRTAQSEQRQAQATKHADKPQEKQGGGHEGGGHPRR